MMQIGMDEDEEDMHPSLHPSAVRSKGKGKEKRKAEDEELLAAIHKCVDQSGQLIRDLQLPRHHAITERSAFGNHSPIQTHALSRTS